MINATDIRKGIIIKHEGELYQVLTYHHATPGNLRGFVQVKLRNLNSGTQKDFRFRSTDRVEKAFLDTQEMSYLYSDGEMFHFMNSATYEQVSLSRDHLGDAVDYLLPETNITVDFYEGKPVGVELPSSVELKVVETEPSLRAATVSNVTKPAKLETGLVVQVPSFVSEGDTLKINTATGEYVSRV
jgi:elongation factor P